MELKSEAESEFLVAGKRWFAQEKYEKTIDNLEQYLKESCSQREEDLENRKKLIEGLMLGQYYLRTIDFESVFNIFYTEQIKDYWQNLKTFLTMKKDVYNMLLISYYHLLIKGNYGRKKIKQFEKYRAEWYELARWFKEIGELKNWSEANIENLIRYNIELVLKKITEKSYQSLSKLEKKFKTELESVFMEFIDIFSVFPDQVFIDQLLVKVYEERQNFSRPGWDSFQNMKNTKWLIEFFLQITADKANYQEKRANVMNLMADIVYFFDENQAKRDRKEEEAIEWLEKSKAEFKGNQFTENRLKELRRNMVTTQQINKFRHDVANKISSLRHKLLEIKHQLSQQEKNEDSNWSEKISVLEEKVDEIDSLFKLTKQETASFAHEDIEELLERIINSFSELDTSCLVFKGRQQPIEIDKEYFIIAVKNLIENSLEAYKRQEAGFNLGGFEVIFDYNSNQCRVKDEAGGIPPEFQINNRLFEPYVSSKGTYQEVGLGLNQVETAVKLHGGEVSYKTDKQGTEFILKFPE